MLITHIVIVQLIKQVSFPYLIGINNPMRLAGASVSLSAFKDIGADSENIKKLLSLTQWHVVRLRFDAALRLHVLCYFQAALQAPSRRAMAGPTG